jgi:hypothetical protein
MSVVVKHDQRRRWIVVRIDGVLVLNDVTTLIATARADVEHRMWPMLVDARAATTAMTDEDVEAAVRAVQTAAKQGPRGHVAIAVTDDVFYARMLLYEARCADVGVRVIRVFRQLADADRWLDIVSAARHYGIR